VPDGHYGRHVDQHRLPLDPPDPPDHAEPLDGTLRVSELLDAVNVALEVCFPDEVWVRGEISSLTRARSGHVYFELVEPGAAGSPPVARIAVTLFSSDKTSVNATLRRVRGVRMTDGVEIRIRGRITVYGAQGRLQLRMSAIDPEYTLGRLASERERLLRTLASDGLLDRNRRLPIPSRPRRVGLVTSARSAAEADFLHELEQSGLGFEVVAVDTAVQGRDAERAISAALLRLVALRVEVIAVVRGGGARTDLAAFDGERLARAIAMLDLPVVTGIGHEVDSSVADQVAHTACKTPTACAALLVARASEFHAQADAGLLGARAVLSPAPADARWLAVVARAERIVDGELDRIRRAEASAVRLASATMSAARLRLDDRTRRVARAAPRSLGPARLRLDALGARVGALDPARNLARGWSITRTSSGRLVRDASEVRTGDELVTTLASGAVHSLVTHGGDRTADRLDDPTGGGAAP